MQIHYLCMNTHVFLLPVFTNLSFAISRLRANCCLAVSRYALFFSTMYSVLTNRLLYMTPYQNVLLIFQGFFIIACNFFLWANSLYRGLFLIDRYTIVRYIQCHEINTTHLNDFNILGFLKFFDAAFFLV